MMGRVHHCRQQGSDLGVGGGEGVEVGVLRGLSVHAALTRHDGRSRDGVCSRREEDGRHLSERWGFPGRRGDQHRGHVEEQDAAAFQAGLGGTWEWGGPQQMQGPWKNQGSSGWERAGMLWKSLRM